MLDRLLSGLTAVPFLLGAVAAPVGHGQVVFSFQDHAITESSGLAVVGNLVVTNNDSGDTGRLFAVDPADGRTVSVTSWESDPTDCEAITPDGHGGVWVGDIGDNSESRDTIQVADVPVDASNHTYEPTVFDLAYPDRAHNAETLMRDPLDGRLYIATKGVLGGTLYAVPRRLSPEHVNQLTPVADVLPIATDGAFLADGKHLVIRNYSVAVVYAFPSMQQVAEFRLPDEPQGEGLAVEPNGTLLLSSEGLHSQVLRVSLPPLSDSPSPSPSPSLSTTPSSAPPSPSPQPATAPAADDETSRSAWPWLVGGLVGLGCVVVVVRSLRPR